MVVLEISRRTEKIENFNNKNIIKIKQVDAIAGACSAYNAKILSKTNLGDEDFFYGPEDVELSYRLRKIGKLLVNQKACGIS